MKRELDMSKGDVERRAELLKLARRSRRLWLYDGCSDSDLKALSECVERRVGKSFGVERNEVPGAKGLQAVLDHLTDVVGDDVHIAVESLLPTFEVDIDEDLDGQSNTLPVYDASMVEAYPYAVFIDRLCHSTAAEIVRGLQHFVKKVGSGGGGNGSEGGASGVLNSDTSSGPELHRARARSTWEHLDGVAAQMKVHVLWTEQSTEEWARTLLCLERLAFGKLRVATYSSTPEEDIADRQFAEHLGAIDFVEPSHVGIKPDVFPTARDGTSEWRKTLAKPIKLMQDLPSLQCPSDMHACIKELTILIGGILRSAADAHNSGSRSPNGILSIDAAFGADDFLPHLILCIREAQPSQLKACVAFLEQYTQPRRLNSEAGYLLTQLMSAVHFLDTVDAEALNMDPELFQRAMVSSRERAEAEMAAASQSRSRLGSASGLGLDMGSGEECVPPPPPVSEVKESKLLQALRAKGPPSVQSVSRMRMAGALRAYT